MEMREAVHALSALALDARLTVFRLLVRSGAKGLNAGDIAAAVGAAPSTLSNNLGILRSAGLVAHEKKGREVHYTARYDRMGELMAFLLEDCCDGSPEVCAPLVGLVGRAGCCAEAQPETTEPSSAPRRGRAASRREQHASGEG